MSNADLNCSSTVNTDEDAQDTSVQDGEDDAVNNSFNTSIIGKVKSRVSGILPNSLSKWFSMNKSKEALDNSSNNNTPQSRRRPRSELEQDDDIEQEVYPANVADEDAENNSIQINETNVSQRYTNKYTSGNISLTATRPFQEYEPISSYTGATSFRNLKKLDLNSKEPPLKRSRFTEHLEDSLISSLEQRQPLLASTPAIENNLLQRNNKRSHFLSDRAATTSRSKFLNLYAHQEQRETAYDFNSMNTVDEPERLSVNLLKRNALKSETSINTSTMEPRNNTNLPIISHRRSGIIDWKRQKLEGCEANANKSYDLTSSRVRSTVIAEVNEDGADEDEELRNKEENEFQSQANNNYNGHVPHQRTLNYVSNGGNVNAEISGEDSGNERRSECDDDNNEKLTANSLRNVSRTSSFGNGLNFYSHLEGRKSLFTNTNEQNIHKSSILNNSSLSLTSLHRRKFNDSIYGSTSALSDSRLLNIRSPFYKGNTTYGGAASCNRYNYKGNNNILSMRTLPIQMRPTSSLSSISSSTQANSLNFSKDNNNEPAVSNMSNTAKRILDLINDFTTPLNEAKKMANNLHVNNKQSKLRTRRLNDNDLHETRAMRLAHVQKPYMRAAVTLQPHNKKNMPPIRELQVPSMSQLLQMKKLQNTTERSRQIINNNNYNLNNNNTTNNNNNNNSTTTTTNTHKIKADYTLPTTVTSLDKQHEQQQQQPQQKHGGKIKNKITASARVTRCKRGNEFDDDANDESPALELPNIAFPLMQNVPKFDIQLPLPKTTTGAAATAAAMATYKTNDKQTTFKLNANIHLNSSVDKTTTTTTKTSASIANSTEYTFSSPHRLKWSNDTLNVPQLSPRNNNFTFCAPDLLNHTTTKQQTQLLPSTTTTTIGKTPVTQLRTGSCLDALKTPLFNKTADTNALKTTNTTTAGVDAWALAKKPSVDWECNACMLRNKTDASKCVACETPRQTEVKEASAAVAATTTNTQHAQIPNAFGDAFKRKADTWECPTCMINNKTTDNACVACATSNPKAAAATTMTRSDLATTSTKTTASGTSFQFGIKSTLTTTTTPSDGLFKTLATAQSAKWECDACMTRNEMARNKCVCCEQVKPGTNSAADESTTFAFGETAKNKYTFGFAAQKPTPKTTAAPTTTTITTTTTTTSMGFTFGTSQDVADAKPLSSASGFKFGVSPTTTTTTAPAKTTAATSGAFSFGMKPTAAHATIATTTTTNSVKFNLNTSSSSSGVTSSSDVNATTTAATPATNTGKSGVFSFAQNATPTTTAAAAATFAFTSTTVSSSTSGTFTLGATMTTPATTTTLTPTTKSLVFNSTAAPTKTTTATGTFTFGGNATTAAPKMLFGGFGGTSLTTAAAATATTITNTTPVEASSMTAVSSSTFGSNLFATAKTMPITTSTTTSSNVQNTVFGSKSAATMTTTTTPSAFVFGAGAMSNHNGTTVSSTTTTTSGTWPKNNFVFGSAQQTPSSSNIATIANSEANNKPIFGNFKPVAATNQSGSLFGTVAKQTKVSATPTEAAGNSSFGGGTSNTNVFQNASFANAPAFGSNPFGNSGNSTPTFGSTAASVANTNTFSGFGARGSGSATNAPAEPQKTEPLFTFGSANNNNNAPTIAPNVSTCLHFP